MSFLAPMMLWGSLAAGIPIALHFFFRSRYRTVPWAAMKFLLLSIEQTSRRLKFQELLLLIVRVTVLVLLAVALARPLAAVVRGAGAGEAVDAVFLFDLSMSMGAGDGNNKTRLERAQDAAQTIIDQLPPHSGVHIVTFADRDRAEEVMATDKDGIAAKKKIEDAIIGYLGPQVPSNLDQARTIIKDLKVTSLSTDMAYGLARANERLSARTQATTNKELYIFSDMQKLGFDQQPAQIKEILQGLKDKAPITFVRCGHPEFKVKNVAITGITLQTSVPRPGERIDFAVLIKNTGTEALKDLTVSVLVDGSEKNGSSQPVPKLGPGETRVVSMHGKLGKAGPCTITAMVKPDDLSGDNRYDLVIQVRDRVNVLVIDGGAVDPDDRLNPDQASSFYLMHGLLPIKETEYGKYYMQVTRKAAKFVAPSLLKDQQLCILVNVKMPILDKDNDRSGMHLFLDELSRFVRDGHGLLIYAGDQVVKETYNKVLGDTYQLLPAKIKKVHTFPAKTPQHLNRDTFNLPIYMNLKNDVRFKYFNDVEVYKLVELEEPGRKGKNDKEESEKVRKVVEDVLKNKDAAKQTKIADKQEDPVAAKKKRDEEMKKQKEREEDETRKKADAVTVALRFSNNMPAVVSRKTGSGEIMFITTASELGFDRDTPYPTWNTWALNPSNSLFLKATINHLLTEGSQEFNFVAGKTLTWYPQDTAERTYTLVYPQTDEEKLAVAAAQEGTEAKEARQERLGKPKFDPISGRFSVSTGKIYQAGIYKMIGTPVQADEEKNEQDSGKTEEKKKETVSPIAVVPDLRETENLETYNNEEINKMIGFDAQHILAGSGEKNSGAERLNREWTLWLLTILLFLTLGESALAYWCGRGW